MLQLNNIRLRALEAADLELLYLWENDIDTWTITSTRAPLSKLKLYQYLDMAHNPLESGVVKFVIEINETFLPVGMVELYDIDFYNRKASVGIVIASNEHKKLGFANDSLILIEKYAKEILNLHQINAFISENNLPSINLFNKNNYLPTAVLKDWILKGEKYYNQIVFQLIF